jgi:hypothetical protein
VSKISAAASKILQKGWRKITVSILQGGDKNAARPPVSSLPQSESRKGENREH